MESDKMKINYFFFKSIFGKSKLDKKNVQKRKAPLKTRKKLFSLHNENLSCGHKKNNFQFVTIKIFFIKFEKSYFLR